MTQMRLNELNTRDREYQKEDFSPIFGRAFCPRKDRIIEDKEWDAVRRLIPMAQDSIDESILERRLRRNPNETPPNMYGRRMFDPRLFKERLREIVQISSHQRPAISPSRSPSRLHANSPSPCRPPANNAVTNQAGAGPYSRYQGSQSSYREVIDQNRLNRRSNRTYVTHSQATFGGSYEDGAVGEISPQEKTPTSPSRSLPRQHASSPSPRRQAYSCRQASPCRLPANDAVTNQAGAGPYSQYQGIPSAHQAIYDQHRLNRGNNRINNIISPRQNPPISQPRSPNRQHANSPSPCRPPVNGAQVPSSYQAIFDENNLNWGNNRLYDMETFDEPFQDGVVEEISPQQKPPTAPSRSSPRQHVHSPSPRRQPNACRQPSPCRLPANNAATNQAGAGPNSQYQGTLSAHQAIIDQNRLNRGNNRAYDIDTFEKSFDDGADGGYPAGQRPPTSPSGYPYRRNAHDVVRNVPYRAGGFNCQMQRQRSPGAYDAKFDQNHWHRRNNTSNDSDSNGQAFEGQAVGEMGSPQDSQSPQICQRYGRPDYSVDSRAVYKDSLLKGALFGEPEDSSLISCGDGGEASIQGRAFKLLAERQANRAAGVPFMGRNNSTFDTSDEFQPQAFNPYTERSGNRSGRVAYNEENNPSFDASSCIQAQPFNGFDNRTGMRPSRAQGTRSITRRMFRGSDSSGNSSGQCSGNTQDWITIYVPDSSSVNFDTMDASLQPDQSNDSSIQQCTTMSSPQDPSTPLKRRCLPQSSAARAYNTTYDPENSDSDTDDSLEDLMERCPPECFDFISQYYSDQHQDGNQNLRGVFQIYEDTPRNSPPGQISRPATPNKFQIYEDTPNNSSPQASGGNSQWQAPRTSGKNTTVNSNSRNMQNRSPSPNQSPNCYDPAAQYWKSMGHPDLNIRPNFQFTADPPRPPTPVQAPAGFFIHQDPASNAQPGPSTGPPIGPQTWSASKENCPPRVQESPEPCTPPGVSGWGSQGPPTGYHHPVFIDDTPDSPIRFNRFPPRDPRGGINVNTNRYWETPRRPNRRDAGLPKTLIPEYETCAPNPDQGPENYRIPRVPPRKPPKEPYPMSTSMQELCNRPPPNYEIPHIAIYGPERAPFPASTSMTELCNRKPSQRGSSPGNLSTTSNDRTLTNSPSDEANLSQREICNRKLKQMQKDALVTSDTSPTLIQDSIDGCANFNDVSMNLTQISACPTKKPDVEPLTMVETFHMHYIHARQTIERCIASTEKGVGEKSDLKEKVKKEKEYVDHYFGSRPESIFNTTLAGFLKAEKIEEITNEAQPQFTPEINKRVSIIPGSELNNFKDLTMITYTSTTKPA